MKKRVLLRLSWVLGLVVGVSCSSWADLVVSGSADDRRAFKRILDNSTGLDIAIDSNGKVAVPAGNPPAGKTKFTELLRGVASDGAVVVTLVLGRNLENVLGGSFEGDGRQFLDLDDTEKFEGDGKSGLGTQASLVIHEIREAYEAKKNKLPYEEAHKRAIEAENAVLKDQGAGQRAASREDCQFPHGAGDFRLFVGWTLADGTAGFEKIEGRVEFKENKRFVQIVKLSFSKEKRAALSRSGGPRWGAVSPICLYEEVSKEKTGVIPVPGAEAARVGTELGQFAPNFLSPLYEGNLIRLSNLRGRKVIVNFWASWCGPCVAEMPDFQSIVHEKRHGKILLLGLNMGESVDDIKIFLRQSVKVTYPLLLDESPPFEITRTYRVITQPSTYFIDERGLIVFRKFGAFTKEELEQAVSEFEKK